MTGLLYKNRIKLLKEINLVWFRLKEYHTKTDNQICAIMISVEPEMCNTHGDFCFLYRYSFSHMLGTAYVDQNRPYMPLAM